jgi:chitinase
MTDSGNVPGVAMYKEITSIVGNAADTFWDPVTDSAYFYNGSSFYGGESPQSVQTRADYVHCNGYGGFMMFSLYDLDPSATLFNDAVKDINGSASSCPTAPPTSSSSPTHTTGSPTASSSPTGTPTGSPTGTGSPTSSPTGSPTGTGNPTGPASGNLLANPGFESGSLSGWTCSSTDAVTTSPVHAGRYALAGAASSSDDAQCTQTVAVSPNTTYTLSGYVDGAYVFIGNNGGGDNWTPGTSGYQQLSLGISTGSATSLTIYVHGWYGEGTYYADDFSLVKG